MANPRYARQRVRGYVREDGTRVRGHYRTRPTRQSNSAAQGAIDPGLIAIIVFIIFLAAIGTTLS